VILLALVIWIWALLGYGGYGGNPSGLAAAVPLGYGAGQLVLTR
jgi:hypothetical protein